jgi:hypothetical protein
MDLQVLDLEVDLLDFKGRYVELQVRIPRALHGVLPGADGVVFVPAHAPVTFYCWTLRYHTTFASPTSRYSSVMPPLYGK